MKEGEELVEIKMLVTKKSFEDYFKKRNLKIEISYLFDLLSRDIDIMRIEKHNAIVYRNTPSLYINVDGNGVSCENKKWSETK